MWQSLSIFHSTAVLDMPEMQIYSMSCAVSRKKKLLAKQAAGKKRMKVSLPSIVAAWLLGHNTGSLQLTVACSIHTAV